MEFRWLTDVIITSTNFFMYILLIFWSLYCVMTFRILCNILKIFAEEEFLRRKNNSDPEETSTSSLPRDIHGAPPESLVVKLAEVIGNFKTLREMALFWCRVVAEVCLRISSLSII